MLEREDKKLSVDENKRPKKEREISCKRGLLKAGKKGIDFPLSGDKS